jgi:hypothetical protein
MKYKDQGKLSSFLDFTLSVAISLIVSIGLPFLFSRLLDFAVARNGTGGGMLWLPSWPDEILWALCGLLFSLPFFVALVGLCFPLVLLLNNLGFQIGINFYPPAWARMPALIGNSVIAVSIAAIFQILFWVRAVHWIRLRLAKSRRARNVYEQDAG